MSSAGSLVPVYTIPATVQYATFNILAVNEGAEEADFFLTMSPVSAPEPADYIEYGCKIPANGGTYERTALIGSPGEIISIRSSSASVAVRVNGICKNL